MLERAASFTRLFGRGSFGTFPFCLGKTFTDGGLFLYLVTAAVVDLPVDHSVIVLHGHFRRFEGIVSFLHFCVYHGKGPGAVSHNKKLPVVGLMVDAVTGCLHLFF